MPEHDRARLAFLRAQGHRPKIITNYDSFLTQWFTWLRKQGHSGKLTDLTAGDLRDCLVAGRGRGIIFLAGGDAPEQRRFSLAHELAHFLIDYARPRARAIEALGPPSAAVLDGQRPPAHHEQVHAALSGVPLGVHLHLLAYDDPAVASQEHDADRLAVELLAPAA